MSRMPASPMAHAGRRAIAFPRLSPATPAVARPQPPPITRETVVPRTPSRRRAPRWRLADTAFRVTALGFALSVLAITGAIAVELFVQSAAARHAFGWSFLWTSVWDPVFSKFGALPFIYGTLATTAIALAIATPLGLGAAICLAELMPRRLGDGLTFLLELLVAVPSVVYGLMGVFVLVPLMRSIGAPIERLLGGIPLFSGPVYGIGLLTAGVLLAVMIVPYIIAVGREVLLAVPQAQRDGALALGATRWETVRQVVLPYARSGILGATFLALARALGETMAVTMVIGNRPEIAASLFAPAHTMAAVLANEFAEAASDVHLAALVEVALVLFGITLVVNAIARLLILGTRGTERARA